MRRLLVLAGALAMMSGLHVLRAQVATGPVDALTLAAVGFVILAAFTVGEVGSSLGLPKVTGFIVAGVALGPSVSDILSERVVSELGMFNTLALGLIATHAGLELDLTAIRRISRTLLATVGAKLLLLPLAVGVPLFVVQRVAPVLPVEGLAANAVLAALVSVLAIGTSPAIALAVIDDAKARGRLADLTLAIAVVKDLVVVVCLAAAIAVSRVVLAGGGELEPAVLLDLAQEIGASLVVGGAVGLVLIQYIRRVRAEMLLAVLVMILVVAEVSDVLHLELLLVFIAAGFVVRNFSDCEHELVAALERISLPIYVVFFTTAGGRIDLATTVALLPLALLLAAGRAGAYAVAGRIGCRFGGESQLVARNVWLAYLPQAGVTLGLVLLSSEALPTLSEPILRLGMALVAVNLLVGPVTLASALRRAGETPGHEVVPATEAAPAEVTAPASLPPEPSVGVAAVVHDAQLAACFDRLGEDLAADRRELTAAELAPRLAATGAWARGALAETVDRRALLRQVGTALDAGLPSAEPPWEAAVITALDRMVGRLHGLPAVVEVAVDEAQLQARPDDPPALRLRLAGARLASLLARGVRRPRRRRSPVRMAARVALEPRLAEAASVVTSAWHRARVEVLSLLADVAAGRREAAEAAAEVDDVLARRQTLAAADLEHAAAQGASAAATAAARVGTPRLATDAVRFSSVEARVRAARARVVADGGAWRRLTAALVETVRAGLHLEHSALVVAEVVERRALTPIRDLRATVGRDLEAGADRLAALAVTAVDPAATASGGLAEVRAACGELYPRAMQIRHRRAAARLRHDTQAHRLVADLRPVVANAPAAATMVAPTAADRIGSPAAVATFKVDLAEHLEAVLVDELVPRLGAILARAVEEVSRVEVRYHDLADSVVFALEVAAEEGDGDAVARGRRVAETLTQAEQRGRALVHHLDEVLAGVEGELVEVGNEATAAFRRVLADPSRTVASRARATVRGTGRQLGVRLEPVRLRVVAAWQRLAEAARGLSEQAVLRDLRIRSGQERLDGAAVRAYLEQRHPASDSLPLPPVVRRLLAPLPLDDRRLFVAHGALLDRLHEGVVALRRGHAPAILVTGPRGCGRSSLLNLFHLRLAGSPLVWPDDAFASRSEGLLAALAAETGSGATVAELAADLTAQGAVVMVDNLEHWFHPSEAGLGRLEAFLELVVATSGRVLWVVAVGATPLAALDQLVALRSTFSVVLEPPPLTWEELAEVIGARERLSGHTTSYVPDRLRRLLLDLRGREPGEAHLRALARVSRGNLRAALLAHARALRPVGDGTLLALPPQLAAFPFLEQLPPTAVAVLAQVMRWGPLDESTLAAAMASPLPALRHALGLLVGCGLLTPLRRGAEPLLAVPVHHESGLALALAELGLHVGVAR